MTKLKDKRIELQGVLESILRSKNVYFQPPENLKINYPCIIYSRTGSDIDRADNHIYRSQKQYNLIYVDTRPDSPIVDTLEELPYCKLDRPYVSDGLYHYPYKLFY